MWGNGLKWGEMLRNTLSTFVSYLPCFLHSLSESDYTFPKQYILYYLPLLSIYPHFSSFYLSTKLIYPLCLLTLTLTLSIYSIFPLFISILIQSCNFLSLSLFTLSINSSSLYTLSVYSFSPSAHSIFQLILS
jgi:hypothetical protein